MREGGWLGSQTEWKGLDTLNSVVKDGNAVLRHSTASSGVRTAPCHCLLARETRTEVAFTTPRRDPRGPLHGTLPIFHAKGQAKTLDRHHPIEPSGMTGVSSSMLYSMTASGHV